MPRRVRAPPPGARNRRKLLWLSEESHDVTKSTRFNISSPKEKIFNSCSTIGVRLIYLLSTYHYVLVSYITKMKRCTAIFINLNQISCLWCLRMFIFGPYSWNLAEYIFITFLEKKFFYNKGQSIRTSVQDS